MSVGKRERPQAIMARRWNIGPLVAWFHIKSTICNRIEILIGKYKRQ